MIDLSAEKRRTKKYTRVADRALPDGKSLGRNRVILGFRLQRTHRCDVADSDCIPVRGGLNSSLTEAANDD